MTTEIAPGLRLLKLPLPFPPGHVNIWLIEDDGGFAVIDAGHGNDDARAAWGEALALCAGPITRIVVTHHHPDHVGLAGCLAEWSGAPVVMTEGEWRRARAMHGRSDGEAGARLADFFARHGLAAEWVEQVRTRGNAYRRGVPNLPDAVDIVQPGDRITLGGRDWRVLTDGGHTPEHMSLYCAADGLLISGDQILPRIPPSISVPADDPGADPMADYMRSLDRHAALPADTLVLPSHGAPFRDLRGRCRELTAICHTRLDEMRERCAIRPQAVADLMGDAVRRPRNLTGLMFAMGGLATSLNHLVAAGELVRREDGHGRWLFAAA